MICRPGWWATLRLTRRSRPLGVRRRWWRRRVRQRGRGRGRGRGVMGTGVGMASRWRRCPPSSRLWYDAFGLRRSKQQTANFLFTNIHRAPRRSTW